MTEVVAGAVAGAVVAAAAVVVASVSAVVAIRGSQRRVDRVQRECDSWREAAAHATVAAKVMESRLPPAADSGGGDGEDWKRGG